MSSPIKFPSSESTPSSPVPTVTATPPETALQSADISALAEALAKAHAAMKAPKKGKTASIRSDKGEAKSYEYSYADLADVIESYRAPLSSNGLAVVQQIQIRGEDQQLIIVTKLLHSSGQWIASEYPIAHYARPQEQGSAITYARRYAVSALLGIAAEDDDDGARAQKSERRDEAAAPPSGDAGLILDLAAEIQQLDGGIMDSIIQIHSAFKGDDGKERSFTDPTRVRSAKWLKGTRERLEATLHKLRAKSEPGAAEGADLFK